MLQDKDTNKISELKSGFTHRWFETDFILGSLTCLKLSGVSKCFIGIKQKGYSLTSLFSVLLSLPYLGQRTVHGLLNSSVGQYIEARKDTFYRLKNTSAIDWRSILWFFALKFIRVSGKENRDTGVKCLILDDSVMQKKGKYIEMVSRVWDHVSGRCVLGYKILVGMYWDGTSCIPLDFSIHREKGKKKDKPFGLKKKEMKKQFSKKREKECYGKQRMLETDISKIDGAIAIIKRVLKKKLDLDYILMDSWFTCWAMVELVKKRTKLHLIGMYKGAKTKFDINGKQLTYNQIRNELGNPVRCRKLGYYYKQAVVGWNGQCVKLFFSKQGKNGKWRTFLTTNTALSFIDMIKIYQLRWSIEVFFKEAKQLLGLGKSQSNDFDAQIADTTLVMIQHLIVTMRYRFENYESKGAIFEQDRERVVRFTLGERIWGLFLELVKVIEILFEGCESDEILLRLLENEEAEAIITQLLGKNHAKQRSAA
ncbi:transposase [uncultured Eudoraea sp.]|uniref:IS4 family transposase n=1 Tax=uncultured Eudoraea sp. TaxID=1035614 RepID=UPI002608E615|nr:transposase [uncultured Eudoraea sp.]